MSGPRTRIVEQGYDVIGDMFADWRDQIVGDPRRHWANELVSRLRHFSSFPPETNRRLLREAGFELVLHEVVTFL